MGEGIGLWSLARIFPSPLALAKLARRGWGRGRGVIQYFFYFRGAPRKYPIFKQEYNSELLLHSGFVLEEEEEEAELFKRKISVYV